MSHSQTPTRMLVLGSMDEFCSLVRRARERGCQVIVADGYPDGPARAYADESYVVDIRDRDAVIHLCREHHIDLILASFSDILFEAGCLAAHELGLPTTCTLQALDYLRDKNLMKRMFSELSIPHSASKTISAPCIEATFEDLSFPCVVKPLNGYGSYDICVARTADDVRDFTQHMAAEGYERALVEEYDTGHEFNMMCWVLDGQVHVLSIADREKTWRSLREVPHVSRIVYPSRFSNEVIAEARLYAQNIANYLNLCNSPLCIQFFWSPDQGVRICEVAGRIFGYEHELLEYASGLAIEDLLLDLALDDDIGKRLAQHDPLTFSSCCCGLYFHTRGGDPCDLASAYKAFEAVGASEWLVYYGESDRMSEGKGGKPYVARTYLQAPSRELLDKTTHTVFETFSVKDTEGRELILHNELPS